LLQYFEKILPLVESLRFVPQKEVFIMGCGAAGGLSRCLRCPASWIRHYRKMAEIEFFLCTFSPKKGEEHEFSNQKRLDHLLLMTSDVVTRATDSNQTCTKTC